MPTSFFALPERLARKSAPDLIAEDDERFAVVAAALAASVAGVAGRLDAERRNAGGTGQQALDRDLEVHRLEARLRTLRRFGADLCLGRIVPADGEPVYIGRLGLTDDDGRRLLVDWRAPAAEPFFAATLAEPLGLVSRRRYRWTRNRVTDYWDEVLSPQGFDGRAAPDDESAFIASLGSSRSSRMRDVLGTIQADQDAIIRAASRGALVVEGGPGTGKTVVALHRAAYLLAADPRLQRPDEGILFVGPHEAYLAYVEDVLPSLGEEGVPTCTLRDLVVEGAAAVPERDPAVARRKASADLLQAIDAAVARYEVPPTTVLAVETPWSDSRIGRRDWAEAFDAVDPGTPHDDAREVVWEALLGILIDEVDDEEVPPAVVRAALQQDEDLTRTFAAAWPLLDPAGVVEDLWSKPDYLRACAPWLTDDDLRLLQRDDARAWTTADLPLLDAARGRIGDPEAPARRRRRAAVVAAERERMAQVVDDLIAADDGEGLVTMLRGADVRNSLDDDAALPAADPDRLDGPFAHVVVDEAQELTDAEWRMLLRRCPSRSLTIVGDRAQARHGFPESWEERLARVGVTDVRVSTLTVGYRTPAEVMAVAEPIIRAVLPDATVPVAVRSSGVPVTEGAVDELEGLLATWLAEHDEGVACVIGAPWLAPAPRVRSLDPVAAKGLEFDLVVLVDPEAFGTGIEGAVDRYVATTRATRELVVLRSGSIRA